MAKNRYKQKDPIWTMLIIVFVLFIIAILLITTGIIKP
jgi:flagellar basal body-associated protein FliL